MPKIMLNRVEYAGSSGGSGYVDYDQVAFDTEEIVVEKSESEMELPTVKYDVDDDYLYVLFNGEWIKTPIKAYAQSASWFLNGVISNQDIFGTINFYTNHSANTFNTSTYQTDGYLKMRVTYGTSSACINAFSEKKIPVDTYSSVTLKFVQPSVSPSDTEVRCIGFGFRSDKSVTNIYNSSLSYYVKSSATGTHMQTLTLDLTKYNENGVPMFFCFGGLTCVDIYEITFNK